MTINQTTPVPVNLRSLWDHNVRVGELRQMNADLLQYITDTIAKISSDTSSAKRMEILFGLLREIRAKYKYDVAVGKLTGADIVISNVIEQQLVEAFFVNKGEHIENLNFRSVFGLILS